MARGWHQDSKGAYRFYDNREGSPTEGQELRSWQWIDGYCYYFEEEGEKKGILLQNGMSKDGYTVNEEGQWTVNGVVQFVEGKGFITKKSDVRVFPERLIIRKLVRREQVLHAVTPEEAME